MTETLVRMEELLLKEPTHFQWKYPVFGDREVEITEHEEKSIMTVGIVLGHVLTSKARQAWFILKPTHVNEQL